MAVNLFDAKISPSKSDKSAMLADFVEMYALSDPKCGASRQDLFAAIGRVGKDKIEPEDAGNDDDDEDDAPMGLESIADGVWDSLERRVHCANASGNWYPFELTPQVLMPTDDADKSLYVFLSLLSWRALVPADLSRARNLFEVISAAAARRYLGWKRAKAVHLGPTAGDRFATRMERFRGLFRECKLHDDLANQLLEAKKRPTPKRGHRVAYTRQDDGIDVLAWIPFGDHSPGKVLLGGQCASGHDWKEKFGECLSLEGTLRHWLPPGPKTRPICAMFVPHAFDRDDDFHWILSKCNMLFDRCRIAELASRNGGSFADEWAGFSQNALQVLRS